MRFELLSGSQGRIKRDCPPGRSIKSMPVNVRPEESTVESGERSDRVVGG